MKKKTSTVRSDELRPEYDATLLKHGVRGKYLKSYKAGANVVLLDADVAKTFKTGNEVNAALRLLLQVAKTATS
jgi:hypothetical protein